MGPSDVLFGDTVVLNDGTVTKIIRRRSTSEYATPESTSTVRKWRNKFIDNEKLRECNLYPMIKLTGIVVSRAQSIRTLPMFSAVTRVGCSAREGG